MRPFLWWLGIVAAVGMATLWIVSRIFQGVVV